MRFGVSVRHAAVLAMLAIGCSKVGRGDSYARGHLLKVASLPAGAESRIYEAAIRSAFDVDPLLTLRMYPRRLARTAGDTGGDPMPGGMEYYVLKHGEKMLGGIMQIEASWGNMPSQWVNYFSVANVDETAATVKKLGGQQMGPTEDSPFGRIAALKDPNGATFKIVEPPK